MIVHRDVERLALLGWRLHPASQYSRAACIKDATELATCDLNQLDRWSWEFKSYSWFLGPWDVSPPLVPARLLRLFAPPAALVAGRPAPLAHPLQMPRLQERACHPRLEPHAYSPRQRFRLHKLAWAEATQ